MKFENTTATRKIFDMRSRIRAVAGGTSASKTISILVWLIDRAQSGRGELLSVVSQTYGHLEKGAMLDFENIMKAHNYWKDASWNKTKHTYTFETGSKIEFFSVDTYGKAHGPRRDILYVNECNNLEYKIVDQLITRTRKIVWLDWNPSEEFWFYTEMQPHRTDVEFITLTYLDNEALDDTTVAEIESHRHNKSWWRVYGEGQLGELEGRIYTGWKLIDEVPHEARLERRGLDFGYSQDPAAIVDVYYYNGGYILDEKLYQRGMGNPQLAKYLNNMEQGWTLVVADSAEPKSIDELREYGVGLIGAEKGPGSLNRGIKHMQSQRISVTRQSYNLIKEYRRYMWKTDKRTGEILAIPDPDLDDHLLDAARYALEALKPKDKTFEPEDKDEAESELSSLIY
jgi:phage terminase large subunit